MRTEKGLEPESTLGLSGSEDVAGPSKKSQKRSKKTCKVLACGFMESGRDVLSGSSGQQCHMLQRYPLRTGECSLN